MTQEIFIIEAIIDFFLRQIMNIRIAFHTRAEILMLHPTLHCIALYPFVSILTQHALADNTVNMMRWL